MNATTLRRSASCLAWMSLGGAVPTFAQQGASDLEEIIVTGAWFGSCQTQYFGVMYECEMNEFAPADAFQGCREIEEGWYQDLQLGYRFEPGLTLTFTVSNLTNEDPPRVNFDAAANTDPATYPLLGRTYFVSLSYRIE